MKKSNFLNGAIVSTLGIVLCKIIGLVYVIPFYAMIGATGGALYSYAYSIYAIFLSLSTSGIPVAMSKLVSEYNALEQYHTKEKAFKIGSTIIFSLAFIAFIALMIFAKDIAFALKGDATGGNSLDDIAFVIRVISTALLVVPLFSVTKGYLRGHKMMTASSASDVLEQLVRVILLLLGSFVTIKVLKLKTKVAVSCAVFSATIGALTGYLFLRRTIKKNEKDFNRHARMKAEEKENTTKVLIKRILIYAIPFVLIDLINSAYVVVNSTTIIKTLTGLGYSGYDAEIVLSSIATWASKLDMIIISVAIGFVTSLIPHITANYVKNDLDAVHTKINQAIEMLLLIVLPMTLGLTFLAQPVWVIFYGYNELSISVFTLYAIQALTYSLHWLLINVMQSLNKSKVTLMTLIAALVFKIIFNVPIMKFLPTIGIEAYQGATITTLLCQIGSIIFILLYLKKAINIKYKPILGNVGKIIFSSLMMMMALILFTIIVDINVKTRVSAVMICVIYATVGMTVYGLLTYKLGLLNRFIKIIKNKRTT